VRVFVVLFFAAVCAGMAQQTEDTQRVQKQLAERDAVIKTLTESLAIARLRASCFRNSGPKRNSVRRRSART